MEKKDIPSDILEKLKTIIKKDVFKEINSIVNICDLNQDEDNILKNIIDYIWAYLSNYGCNDFLMEVQKFISFIEHFNEKNKPCFTLPNEEGKIYSTDSDLLVISNGHHIYGDFRFHKGTMVNGFYMSDTYLGCDGKIYLSKKSMLSKSLPVNREIRAEVDYNSILAENVFKFFNLPSASYYLLKNRAFPFNYVVTENFLQENQELVHLSNFDVSNDFVDTHTNRLNLLIDNLKLRYKEKMSDEEFQRLIEKIQLEYCMQNFIKLLIGPMDVNFGNTAIILTHEEGCEVPKIDISPAYDLDISFHISDELLKNHQLSQVSSTKDSNIPVTIDSLIEEFANIPGFDLFLKKMADLLSTRDVASEIVDTTIEKTNLSFYRDNRQQYISFLNEHFMIFLKAFKKHFLDEEVKDESILGRYK